MCVSVGGSLKVFTLTPASGKQRPMSVIYELSKICAERNPNRADQRRRLVALLKSGVDIHATDKNGVTALHHAVRFRSPIAVKTLIEHGANVNQICRRSGSTPLHRAVTTTGAPGTAGKRQEALEIIRLLIAAGADSSIANKSRRTPADYTKDDTIKALLKNQQQK
jgi:uncharacterized protein